MKNESSKIFSPQSKKAVTYVRHSDDRQQNSAEIQLDEIRKFAHQHEILVLKEFVDRGTTGLTEDRPAFQELLRDWVKNPNAPPFDYVIVYDISRFSRAHDLDKSAALEYACKENNKQLIAVIRGIPEKGQELAHHLLRVLDRYNAADFVNTLSTKVKLGAIKVSKQGFSAGGSPCYGLERQLLDEHGEVAGILKPGERKAIRNHRIKFLPSEGHAGRTICRIFDEFVTYGRSPESIANGLNDDEISSPGGFHWKATMVRKTLRQPAYAGCLIYNKTSGLLKTPRRKNPKNQWVIVPEAFPPLIDNQKFLKAQELLVSEYHEKLAESRRYLRHFQKWLSEMLASRHTDKSKYSGIRDSAYTSLPLLVSINFRPTDNDAWCFRLPSGLSSLRILCIGLPSITCISGKYIPGGETFFTVPLSAFGIARYGILSADSEYRVASEDAESFLEKEV